MRNHLGFGVGFVGLVAFAGWGLSILLGLRASWQELARVQAARRQVDATFAAFRALNVPGNDVLADYDVPTNRAAFAAARQAHDAALARLRGEGEALGLGERLRALAADTDDMVARTATILDEAAARERLRLAGAPEAEIRARETAAAAAMALMDRAFQRGLDALVGMNDDLGARAEARLVGEQAATTQLFALLTFALLAAGLALELLRRRARQQAALERLTAVADRIVRDGDLTQEIDVDGADATGTLAAALRALVARLRELPAGLRDSSRLLGEAVRTVTAATEFQAQSATRQAAALQETQVTAEELRQTSRLAAEKAEAVAGVLAQTDALAREGEAAVEQHLAGLTDIHAYAGEVGGRVRALDETTRQIASITQAVKDLADQSNLLALNAAIEAARSGEHGRGFAVVAREIRSLADQSIEATRRVGEILAGVRRSVAEVVEFSDRGKERMEMGIIQARASGESLRELSALTREVGAATRQIAAAVGQQNAGISQIFTAVSDQTKMMDDTVARVRGVRDAAESLERVSTSVAAVVAGFRT